MKTIIIAIMLQMLSESMNLDGVMYLNGNYMCFANADNSITAQSIVDDPELLACFPYGTYGQTTYADHCNQDFKFHEELNIYDKVIEKTIGKIKGDILYIVNRDTIQSYKCIKVKTIKVAKDGQLYEKKGQYIGDRYKGKTIILYTCKNKKERIVTYWKEV